MQTRAVKPSRAAACDFVARIPHLDIRFHHYTWTFFYEIETFPRFSACHPTNGTGRIT
jgi:hypothetical protein